MPPNNLRETQETTSGSQECSLWIFSPGVHTKFYLAISPILWLRVKNWVFIRKFTIFFWDFQLPQCLEYEDTITLRESMSDRSNIHEKINSLFLVCTQKAHNLQILKKNAKLLSQNSENKGKIWWTPGEKQINAFKNAWFFTHFDIFG